MGRGGGKDFEGDERMEKGKIVPQSALALGKQGCCSNVTTDKFLGRSLERPTLRTPARGRGLPRSRNLGTGRRDNIALSDNLTMLMLCYYKYSAFVCSAFCFCHSSSAINSLRRGDRNSAGSKG